MKLFEGVSIDRRSHWEMIILVIGKELSRMERQKATNAIGL